LQNCPTNARVQRGLQQTSFTMTAHKQFSVGTETRRYSPFKQSAMTNTCKLLDIHEMCVSVKRRPFRRLFDIERCFSTFVRPRPGKFFFYKTRARSQQIYSLVTFQFFLSSDIKLTLSINNNYGIITESISTITYTVWHVDKYKITLKLIINSRRISRGPV